MIKLSKTHTGLASEFYVMAELTRRGYNATMTFGNTKAIDLIVELDGQPKMVQVKGIQRTKSNNWNVSEGTLGKELIFVLVNLHADTMSPPEFFVLTDEEMHAELKRHVSDRNYLSYHKVKKMNYQDRWDKLQ